MRKKKKILYSNIVLSILFLAFIVYSHPVRAAIGPLLDDALIKKAQCSEGDCSLNTFIVLGIRLSDIILGVVGSLTLLMFVYGGVTLLLSGGNSETVSKGKSIILGSVVGLCIVFGSYTIIKFTVNNILEAKPGYEFTGNAPADVVPERGKAPKCKGTCIKDNAVCVNSYKQPGITESSDCGQGQKCCIAKEPPADQTCLGSNPTDNTCVMPPFTCSGSILSLPCQNGGRCCNIPS